MSDIFKNKTIIGGPGVIPSIMDATSNETNSEIINEYYKETSHEEKFREEEKEEKYRKLLLGKTKQEQFIILHKLNHPHNTNKGHTKKKRKKK